MAYNPLETFWVNADAATDLTAAALCWSGALAAKVFGGIRGGAPLQQGHWRLCRSAGQIRVCFRSTM